MQAPPTLKCLCLSYLQENTRLRKNADGSFDILIASAVTKVPSSGGDIGTETEFTLEDGPLKGHKITLVYGDHSKELQIIAGYHKKAAKDAANDNQKNMQFAYAKSFEEGSLEAFKQSQRYWIRDKGPIVESNIGFVETYQDPQGVRGMWEGEEYDFTLYLCIWVSFCHLTQFYGRQ